MTLEVQDVEDVGNFLELDDQAPNGILVLPNNYNTPDSNFFYSSTLPTIKKLSKSENIPLLIIGDEASQNLLEQRSKEWYGPVLLIGTLFYSQNPYAISIALSMISNYLSKIFSGQKDSIANLSVYVRDDKNKLTKRIDYKGSVSGLSKVNDTVEKVMSEYGIEQNDE